MLVVVMPYLTADREPPCFSMPGAGKSRRAIRLARPGGHSIPTSAFYRPYADWLPLQLLAGSTLAGFLTPGVRSLLSPTRTKNRPYQSRAWRRIIATNGWSVPCGRGVDPAPGPDFLSPNPTIGPGSLQSYSLWRGRLSSHRGSSGHVRLASLDDGIAIARTVPGRLLSCGGRRYPF